ncbi:hypothetical protein ACODM8_13875 [Vibrio ostreicida]|uniref:Uncharacterized protein n=1 Tax=Vibrio ostreicida TaxID=526588 RepID=A0ABT8BRQ6_9VIBR|nr:hypothetical protein [Vibrio ostreicida]MDN3609812.1 hypothetical protein [Vibrio ostreicida]NPD09365.1 hypothetical protein [Vibrio ostreicida]
MARRKEFKGIAINYCKYLNGRNHDYSGYWAVGHLSLLAEEREENTLVFELFGSQSNQSCSGVLKDLSDSMLHEFIRLVKAQEVPLEWVGSVCVRFQFNPAYDRNYHLWRQSLGKRYIVVVKIITDSGLTFEATEGGYVYPHNPSREQRR